MSKRSPRSKLYEWRITRIRSTPAAFIGYVQASDAEQAVKEAIAKYEISKPHEQPRLAAQRGKRSVKSGHHAGQQRATQCHTGHHAARNQYQSRAKGYPNINPSQPATPAVAAHGY
jgi:hypothetical protein